MPHHNYTPEQIAWLKKARRKYPIGELQRRFNLRYGASLSKDALHGKCLHHGFITGRTGQYNKGNCPWNKNKKGLRHSPATEFKKGNVPPNYKPVGCERINSEGIIEIKIRDPRTWRSKHSLLWEQHHGRNIPRGHVVIFIDGDKRNIIPDNLALVSRGELVQLNKQHFSAQHDEIKPALIGLVKLESAANRRASALTAGLDTERRESWRDPCQQCGVENGMNEPIFMEYIATGEIVGPLCICCYRNNLLISGIILKSTSNAKLSRAHDELK